MGLGTTLKNWVFDVADTIAYPFELALAWGVERATKRVMPNSYTYVKETTRLIEEAAGSPTLKELVESGKLAEVLKIPSGPEGHHSAPIYDVATIHTLSAIASVIGSPFGLLPFLTTFYEAGWGKIFEQRAMEVAHPTLLNVAEAIHAYFRKEISEEDLKGELSKGGYNETRVRQLLSAMRPLLDPNTIRQLQLRGETPLAFLRHQLEAAGWNSLQITAIESLYQIIPGVQDLIRMAVREAFSPEIVAKFQTDADFPLVFAEWAAKQGLSLEWSKNYWRAHWDLPSITQGFEMFHRGIITEEELQTLLRTLDVMPFWRERLTKMTYSLPTRVDIRRIYNLGIRDRAWVKEQYKKLGYAEDDAEALTEFTTKLATSADKDLTKTDILSLFKKGVIDEDTTREYLLDLDYSEEEVDYLIAKESTTAAEETRELSLSQIKSLALTGIIDKTEATKRMADLGYTADDIVKLYSLWTLEAPPQDALPSRTDLRNFYQAGIIDIDTWIDYMYQLRYSEEVIAWYYQQMTSSK